MADALRPFREAAPEPAGLGVRVVANMLDSLISTFPMFVAIALTGYGMDVLFLSERSLFHGLCFLGQMGFGWMHFAFAEGIWGAGFGKALCGIRVARPDGSPPGIWRALGRVSIFETCSLIPMAITWMLFSGEDYRRIYDDSDILTDWLTPVVLVVLFITMRRANGWATIYDLATGTRVVRRDRGEQRPPVPAASPSVKNVSLPEQFGPYQVSGQLNEQGGNALLLGHDPGLRRDVWIHLVPPDAPMVSARPTRLRWLNGQRESDANWDAYEAPAGRALLQIVRSPQPWSSVRFWLRDLVEEFQALQEDGETELHLDRAWVREDGRLVVLDFPAPGVVDPEFAPCTSLESLQDRLADLADRAHRGEQEGVTLQGPRPVAAGSFLTRLKDRAFDSLPMLLGNLQSLTRQPALASGRLRIGAILIALVPALFLSVILYFSMITDVLRWDKAWEQMFPDRPSLRLTLLLDVGTTDEHLRNQMLLYTASEFGDLLDNTAFWEHPKLGRQMLTSEREYIAAAVELLKVLDPTPEELEGARNRVARLVAEISDSDHEIAIESGLFLFVLFYVFGATCSLLGGLIIGQPPVLRAMGMAVVNHHGQPASRWRALARWALGWLPALFLFGAAWYFGRPALLILVAFALVVIGLRSRPWQAWFEWFTGSYLVPR